MKKQIFSLPTAVALALGLAATSSAAWADDKIEGTILGFECGDNCYLRVQTAAGEEVTGLCEAEICTPWFENQQMPEDMIGKSVSIVAGQASRLMAKAM